MITLFQGGGPCGPTGPNPPCCNNNPPCGGGPPPPPGLDIDMYVYVLFAVALAYGFFTFKKLSKRELMS
ncbi:hypothetical protein [Winogradskyella maritima]|uniref:Uncharacterized protein n=1 Tax=Winogradskyella maritima TaxID=1517766 RepID=A0ABV8AHR5_9FLAO